MKFVTLVAALSLSANVLADEVQVAVGANFNAPSGTSILNHLPARVETIGQDFHPALALVRLAVNGQNLVARVTRRSAEALALAPGKAVWAQIKAVAVIG